MGNQHLEKLMKDLYESHRTFRSAFYAWHNNRGNSAEPDQVKVLRTRFVEAERRLFEKLEVLRDNFEDDRAAHSDAVIEFLEIDIPAFRCGYEKEKFLRKIKSVDLNEDQKTRLKDVAVGLAARGNFRRELRGWSRLMIALADERFIASLREAIEGLDYGRARYGERMLNAILENRPDLRTHD